MSDDCASPHSALHAAYYADEAEFRRAVVLDNCQVARGTYRMRVDAADIAARILPGQFVMVRLANQADPLLGRAFALYDVVRDATGRATALDFVYVVHGKLTAALAACDAGREIELWGPLGNGFTPVPCDVLLMIAGGVGYTPFLALAKEVSGQAKYGAPPREAPHVPQVMMGFGVRNADWLAGEADFRSAGVDLRVASDDGSVGHQGLVTDLLGPMLAEAGDKSVQVVCCGPEPMMAATSNICGTAGVACRASLETPMACGIGVCFSCVAKIRQADGEWDYKRTCVEGPIFDASQIEW